MDDGGGFEIENDVMHQLVANAVCGKLTFLGFHEKTKCSSIYFVCFCCKGALGVCHGLVQFLSFLYIFPEKIGQMMSWHLPPFGVAPLGNAGSAAEQIFEIETLH